MLNPGVCPRSAAIVMIVRFPIDCWCGLFVAPDLRLSSKAVWAKRGGTRGRVLDRSAYRNEAGSAVSRCVTPYEL